MSVQVEIADRMYDYTDEEKASKAVSEFQIEMGLGDEEAISIWADPNDPRQQELERRIFEAVDGNGPVKRAREHVPGGLTLSIA